MIRRNAHKLAQLAYSDKNPQLFIARWLSQDFNKIDAAIAILALQEVTGEFWRHPETPNPTLRQETTRPAAWTDAILILKAELATLPETQAQPNQNAFSLVNSNNRSVFDPKPKGQRPEIRFVKPKRRGEGKTQRWAVS